MRKENKKKTTKLVTLLDYDISREIKPTDLPKHFSVIAMCPGDGIKIINIGRDQSNLFYSDLAYKFAFWRFSGVPTSTKKPEC